MTKERLEKIKKENSIYLGFKTNNHVTLTHTMPIDDINWLIEQAERVQELENVNRVLNKANVGSERAKERLRKWVDELEIENERYREALKRMEEIGIQGMLAELEELEDEE